MARTLISNASGNLTGASTFALAETGAGALALVRNTTTSLAINASTNSSTFTVTNTDVIDGVILWLKNSSTAAGTIKIALQLSGVDQASVTVNRSDLPSSSNTNPSPVFFKFSSTATGDGTGNWRLQITLNNAGAAVTANINSSTAADWTRALRTTTAGTPAATDDLYVVGEQTGASTSNALTVTMDQTATTAYGSGLLNTISVAGGGIHVGQNGTLQFGTSASTNYLLRINGDLNVWSGGTLNKGTSGTPIPATSTATLKFVQNTLDGDFGLICNDGSTFNDYGDVTTRNVVKCLLAADFSSANLVISTAAITTTNGTATNPSVTQAGIYTSYGAVGFVDNATGSAYHAQQFPSVGTASTAFTHRFWIARGTGTNNRYIRCGSVSATVNASPAQGFYVDVDLQAGTIGATGVFGTSTYTSSAIAAQDSGYLVTVTGNHGASTTNIPFIASASALGTVSYTGNTTQCFIHRFPESYSGTSIPAQTTLTVDSNTGWKAGDLCAIASTTRTIQDCEPFVLASDATFAGGVGTLTATLNLLYAHSGTSPTQAEVINLTRNSKICADTAALMTYCSFSALATVTMSGAEFYYCGANAGAKGCLTLFATAATNAKSFNKCSLHDMKGNALTQSSTNLSFNTTFSYNTLWNTAVLIGPSIIIAAVALTDWTFDNNVLIRNYSGNGFTLQDVGGTFTNNTVVGVASNGIAWGENNTIGTNSGNTAHSCANIGNVAGATGLNGTITNLTAWRNGTVGFAIQSNCVLKFVNYLGFGSSINFNIQNGVAGTFDFLSPVMAGDTSFSSAVGLNLVGQGMSNVRVENGQFGVASGIFTTHTQGDLAVSSAPADTRVVLLNTILASPTELSQQNLLDYHGYVSSQKNDQTAGNHLTWMRSGMVQSDSTIYRSASPSMRMTPASALTITGTITNGSGVINVTAWSNGLMWSSLSNGQLINVSAGFAATQQTISSFSASAGTITVGNNATGSTGTSVTLTPYLKLESAPKNHGMLVPVASGASKNISVWVRKSAAGDGTSYNGAQPRLIQRSSAAIGIASDIVLATASLAAGTWELLSATAAAPSGDNGALESVVDCDGTAGWINVDDWAVA